MKQFRLSKSVNVLIFLLIVLTFSLAPPMTARAQSQKVVILPFTVNAEKDLTYIKEGISQMLSSRLAWKDKILMIPGKTILDEIKRTPQLSGAPLVTSIIENTDANYIISGSITEFAGTFSLDTAVYTDTSGIPVYTFFGQANTPDDIIPEMSNIAAKVNQSVFNRITTLGDSKGQQTTTEEELTRANPEKLIPQVIQDIPPEQKPFWQFWKKEKPPAYPDENFSAMETDTYQEVDLEMDDDDLSEEKVPFWKFWKKDNADDITDEMDSDPMEIPEKDEFEEGDAKKPFWKFW